MGFPKYNFFQTFVYVSFFSPYGPDVSFIITCYLTTILTALIINISNEFPSRMIFFTSVISLLVFVILFSLTTSVTSP